MTLHKNQRVSDGSSAYAFKKQFRYLSYWNPIEKNAAVPAKQVVTCFIQKNDKVVILQRARRDKQHGMWGIPGGKLDKDELPVPGLLRELKEETNLDVNPTQLKLLGTALSHTSCDGQYGLYLFHLHVPSDTEIEINESEHYAYKWVTLREFESSNLLTAQGEAYYFVKNKLKLIMRKPN